MIQDYRRHTGCESQRTFGIAMTKLLLVIGISAIIPLKANAQATPAVPQSSNASQQSATPARVRGSLIVKFVASADSAQIDAVLSGFGAERVTEYRLIPGLIHLRVPESAIQAVTTALARNPLVEYVEFDYEVNSTQSVTPDDRFFADQWALLNSGQVVNRSSGLSGADIRATEAWGISTGGAGCLVAVIDSGMQIDHPDLAPNLWRNPKERFDGKDTDGNGYVDDLHGWDFVDNDNNPSDANGHGTHVSGTIAAASNNNTGVAGVAWTCQIMPLRFLDANGSGSISAAIKALEYALLNGVKISNNSWGGGGYNKSMYDMIKLAGERYDHLFVAAAGNSGANSDTSPMYPAAYNLPNIVSVAATDSRDRLASFSNFGVVSVDIGAPGVNILSTYTSGRYAYLNGTSMAAPHVAGVAGLIANRYPQASYAEIALILLGSARPLSSLSGKVASGGMLNAYASLINADALFASAPVEVPYESEPENPPTTEPDAGSPEITPTAPSSPDQLQVTNNRNSTATLVWMDKSDNEEAFVIERQKLNGGGRWSGSTTITTAANAQEYVDGPGAGTYRYRVYAQNAAGSSDPTPWVEVSITRR
jgi:subtilisin family serine protease